MSSPQVESRVVVSPSKGARVCVAAGLILFSVAAYLLFVPLDQPTKDGAPFRCGTAWAPEAGDFARAACGGINDQFRLMAYVTLFAAVVVIGAGFWAFGTTRTVQKRTADEAARPGDDEL